MFFDLDSNPEFKEELRNALTPWGDNGHTARWSGDIECPSYRKSDPDGCGLNALDCTMDGTFSKWTRAIIGFSRNIRIGDGKSYLGTLIFQCPIHHHKFWIHCRGELIMQYLKKTPQWPKGDLEKVQKLLEKWEAIREGK